MFTIKDSVVLKKNMPLIVEFNDGFEVEIVFTGKEGNKGVFSVDEITERPSLKGSVKQHKKCEGDVLVIALEHYIRIIKLKGNKAVIGSVTQLLHQISKQDAVALLEAGIKKVSTSLRYFESGIRALNDVKGEPRDKITGLLEQVKAMKERSDSLIAQIKDLINEKEIL